MGQTKGPGLQFAFDDHGCKALFRKYPAQAEMIRDAVQAQVGGQIALDFSKTKLASRRPYHGRKLYECRVNVGKLPAVRVAFAVHGKSVAVAFMSTDIQKSVFTKELDAFLRLRQGGER